MKALITGAAAGLGRALTDQLLAEGHDVVAIDVDGEALARLERDWRGAIFARPLDLADGRAIERVLNRHRNDSFDLVVLNAGISAAGRFEDIPLQRHLAVVDINLKAPIKLASGLVGAGLMAERSTIVFVSSLSHVTGYPGASVYAASKDGLAVYADSVRKAWKKKGVRVTTVFPGPIRTDHAARYAPVGASAKRRMVPEKLAAIILKAARKGPAELFPGGAAARIATRFAPKTVLRGLRKALLDKMDEPRL